MDAIDTKLTELLTGNVETDDRLRAAYEMGLRSGRTLDRESLKRNTEIETTKRLLAALMRAQQLNLQSAMVALSIPRKERKTYIKIFTEKTRQKQARCT